MRDEIPMLLMFIPALAMIALYIWSVAWAFGDAESRGKSGCLVALLVALLSWPVGLLIWLVFRPEDKRDDDSASQTKFEP